jgi:hypothetical protein
MAIQDLFSAIFSGGGSGAMGAVINGIAVMGQILLYGAILLGGLFFYLHMRKYKHTVEVIIKKGGGQIERKKDRVREKTDDQGKKILQFLKLKNGRYPLTASPPGSKYVYVEGKHNHYKFFMDDNALLHPVFMGLKERLKLWKNKEERLKYDREALSRGENVLSPVKTLAPTENEAFLKPHPHDLRAWARLESKRQDEKLAKQDRFKELLQLAGPYIAWIFTFLILWFMFKEIGGGFGELADGMKAVAESCLGAV